MCILTAGANCQVYIYLRARTDESRRELRTRRTTVQYSMYCIFVRRRLVCLPGFAKNQAVNTRWYRNPWSSRRRQSTYSSKIGLLLTVRSKFEDFYFIFNFHTVQDARYTVLFSEIRTAHGGRTLQLASS